MPGYRPLKTLTGTKVDWINPIPAKLAATMPKNDSHDVNLPALKTLPSTLAWV